MKIKIEFMLCGIFILQITSLPTVQVELLKFMLFVIGSVLFGIGLLKDITDKEVTK